MPDPERHYVRWPVPKAPDPPPPVVPERPPWWASRWFVSAVMVAAGVVMLGFCVWFVLNTHVGP